MKQPVGLRFVYPDLASLVKLRESAAVPHGLGLVTSPAGRLDWVQGEVTVQQALELLLSTRPGERVMRPDYGCDLHRLAFEPNDETTAGVAIFHVRRAIARWEPRVEILSLDAGPAAEDPGRLDVALEYRVRFLPETHHLRWSVFVSEEGAR
jgi:uncharacterized protein